MMGLRCLRPQREQQGTAMKSPRAQGSPGQALLLVMIILAGSGLLMVPLMSQLSSALNNGEDEREQRYKVLAAEAAIERTKADLVRGADGVATTYRPIRPGFPATVYQITTAYTPPSVSIAGFTPSVTVTTLPNQFSAPTQQPDYFDPGVIHPQFVSVPTAKGYLMRLYNVKPGIISINWAYNVSGSTSVGLFAGMPGAGTPIAPGQISSYPTDTAILTRVVFVGTNNKLGPITVDPLSDGSGGVYTIVFFNNTGSTITTSAFSASGATANTWVYATSFKDYAITATVGSINVRTQVRQVPGFSEPPAITGVAPTFSYTWATNNVAFLTNAVYDYTWLSP